MFEIAPSSTMTDEVFASLKQAFENNRKLAQNPEAIQKEMEKCRSMMDDALASSEGEGREHLVAVYILLQGYNFLARYLDEPEVIFPNLEDRITGKLQQPDPITNKHVAISVPDETDSPLFRSVERAVGTVLDPAKWRYKIYDRGTKVLLKDILAGKVCGILAFGLSGTQSSIESHLRHDLKNLPGWNYPKAELYTLPPCVDLSHGQEVVTILNLLPRMQEGEYIAEGEDGYYIGEAMPSLSAHFLPPKRIVTVLLVDDNEKEMEGMLTTLKGLPNIHLYVHLQKDKSLPEIPDDLDILLLDEAMPLSGREVYKYFLQEGFTGAVVSTTSGDKPDYAPLHFGRKRHITKSFETALQFVLFLNELVRKVEGG